MSALSNKIRETMAQLDMTQKDLAKKCALPKSTVSMYLSGKATPSNIRLVELANALGVSLEYLMQDDSGEEHSRQTVKLRIGVRDAAGCLGKGCQFVREGLKSGRLPFGGAVQNSEGRWTYYINPVKFRDYVTPEIFDRYFEMT